MIALLSHSKKSPSSISGILPFGLFARKGGVVLMPNFIPASIRS